MFVQVLILLFKGALKCFFFRSAVKLELNSMVSLSRFTETADPAEIVSL